MQILSHQSVAVCAVSAGLWLATMAQPIDTATTSPSMLPVRDITGLDVDFEHADLQKRSIISARTPATIDSKTGSAPAPVKKSTFTTAVKKPVTAPKPRLKPSPRPKSSAEQYEEASVAYQDAIQNDNQAFNDLSLARGRGSSSTVIKQKQAAYDAAVAALNKATIRFEMAQK